MNEEERLEAERPSRIQRGVARLHGQDEAGMAVQISQPTRAHVDAWPGCLVYLARYSACLAASGAPAAPTPAPQQASVLPVLWPPSENEAGQTRGHS